MDERKYNRERYGSTGDADRRDYDRRRKERMLARRRRQVRRRLAMVGGFFLVVAVVLSAAGVRAYRGAQNEKRRQASVRALSAKYEEVMQSAGHSAESGESDGQGFAEWVAGQYPEETAGALADAAMEGDGTLSDADVYESLGRTMHVLRDGYLGRTKDTETARENGIYIKDGSNAGSIQISAAGDLCFAEEGFVLDHYDEVNDLEACISPEILDVTTQADLFFVNHEYAISDRGEPLEGKYYTFRAKPERMALLEQMGTDLVSLANNHVYDYGPDAMTDTMDLLDEAGIPYVGGGRNIEEAKKPVYFVINGVKIGFVGASSAEKIHYTPQATEDSPGILEAYDTTEFNQVIREASGECDYLIAYIHWGEEDNPEYAAYQTEEGTEFLESGADIVIGGHPHVLQGIEYIGGKPVAYSMGDFWFNDETKYTGLLNLEITYEGLKEMSFTPCLQTGYTTQYISDGAEQRKFYDYLEGLSPNIEIDDAGVITERADK